jgi:sensor domain CHASE-containing protein
MPIRFKRSLRKAVWIVRRGQFVPWVMTLCGITLSAVMWYGLTANEDLLIRERTVELTTSIKREIETHFAEQLAALGRMAKRWEIRGGTPHGEWENDANSYIPDHSGYRTIAIIGPNTKMR